MPCFRGVFNCITVIYYFHWSVLTFFAVDFFFLFANNKSLWLKFKIITSPQDVPYGLSIEKADFRRLSPDNRCFLFPINQVSPSLMLILEGLILVYRLDSTNTLVFYYSPRTWATVAVPILTAAAMIYNKTFASLPRL